MSGTALARNRGRPRATAGVSLFPFLAVLICTMGALVLLLVLVARQARLQAAEAAEVDAGQEQDDLKIAREDSQWRIERWTASLEKAASKKKNDRRSFSKENGYKEESISKRSSG